MTSTSFCHERIGNTASERECRGIRPSLHRRQVLAGICLSVVGGLSMAAKPDGDDQGKGKKQKKRDGGAADVKVGAYFDDQHRAAALAYYGQQHAKGRCPPGLAKKNNGCMPPGQAKKWTLGQPLPGSVVVYPVAREVVTRIGVPPPGYKYVRVANDILLIAIGTQMVIDAIQDLIR